jgi:hypothetical protein
VEFLQNHWKYAHSTLFGFHIQPLNPLLSCAIIHVITDTKGKGNENTVTGFLDLKDFLEFCYNFETLSLVFDGDSCFDGLQKNMFTYLSEQSDAEGPGIQLFGPTIW